MLGARSGRGGPETAAAPTTVGTKRKCQMATQRPGRGGDGPGLSPNAAGECGRSGGRYLRTVRLGPSQAGRAQAVSAGGARPVRGRGTRPPVGAGPGAGRRSGLGGARAPTRNPARPHRALGSAVWRSGIATAGTAAALGARAGVGGAGAGSGGPARSGTDRVDAPDHRARNPCRASPGATALVCAALEY